MLSDKWRRRPGSQRPCGSWLVFGSECRRRRDAIFIRGFEFSPRREGNGLKRSLGLPKTRHRFSKSMALALRSRYRRTSSC